MAYILTMDQNKYNQIWTFKNDPTISNLKPILNDENFRINKPIIEFYNLTLLHFKQPYQTMKYLLDKGGDPNCGNLFGSKPIHFQKEYPTIRLLVDRGAIPNPLDVYDLSPLFWQKDLESTKYLLNYNPIVNNFIISPTKMLSKGHYYVRMLIDGGYDPYNETNISITPIFLQKDKQVLDYLLDYSYVHNIVNVDLAYETLLFKPCITPDIIDLFDENNQDLNHQNIIGNTALHIQHAPKNILMLLKCGADYTIKNMEGLTAYEYHKKRNNLLVYSLIQRFSAATKIINIWKKYWFIKNYVPPKNFKIKTKFMNEFKLLPPSECGLFPGGIEYQNAYDDFKSICNL